MRGLNFSESYLRSEWNAVNAPPRRRRDAFVGSLVAVIAVGVAIGLALPIL